MQHYALPLKIVHFCVAFLVLGLLILGLYMKGRCKLITDYGL